MSDSVNRGSEEASTAATSPPFHQMSPTNVVVNVINSHMHNVQIGNNNFMGDNGGGCPQGTTDSGSDSNRPSTPNNDQRQNDVTTKTLRLMAHCSMKAVIPVRFLLMVVEFVCNGFKESILPDSYRSQLKHSFGLKYDPFDTRYVDRSFRISKKCKKLFREVLDQDEGHGRERVDDISSLGELYKNVFCVEDDENWLLQQQLLPHLDKWFKLAEQNNIESNVDLTVEFLTLCLHAFGRFRWTGWEDRLKNLCQKCLEHCKSAPDNIKERMYREVGETYRKLGYPTDAENYLRKALGIHKASSKDGSLPYQICLMLLARCKIDMGKYQKAHDLMKACLHSKAVTNLEETGKLGRPYLLCRMYFEMARSCEKLGKFGDAYKYCDRALEDDNRQDGFRHPQYLMHLAYYKALSFAEGNDSEQRAVFDATLADCSRADSILRERHGEDHHHRAHVLCIQARIWLLKNDPGEALRRAKRALKITKKRYGSEHNKTAKMLDLFGDIYKARGDNEMACKAYWKAKNMYAKKRHSRAEEIEQKLANIPASEYKRSELFEELVNSVGSLSY